MKPAALPEADRLLSTKEAAASLHMNRGAFVALVESEPYLRAARRYRGGVRYFLASGVVRYLHFAMSAEPESAPRAAPVARTA